LYFTKEKQEDGSEICYGHNKPTLEESDIVWKFTAGAIGISTDGGKTYSYGLTVSGEFLANVLSVYGINAEWIVAGMLKDKAGKSYWNLDKGELYVNGYFKQETADGIRSVDILNNKINIYDWTSNGNKVGSIGAVRKNVGDRVGLDIYCNKGDFLSLGCEVSADEQTTKTSPVIEIDSETHENSTPWIKNTANGTLFPNNPNGGITIENGLIKKWNMFAVADGTLSPLVNMNFDSNGRLSSYMRAHITVKDGLISA
jgi:hypothetical protein